MPLADQWKCFKWVSYYNFRAKVPTLSLCEGGGGVAGERCWSGCWTCELARDDSVDGRRERELGDGDDEQQRFGVSTPSGHRISHL